MNAELLAELQRRALEIDCIIAHDPEEREQVNAYYRGEPLGIVLDGTFITCPDYMENADRNEVYFKMQALINDAREYVGAYQKGTYPAYVQIPEGYRLLTDYNRIFLAATKMELGGYQFVTWQLETNGRTSLCNGRYTTDFTVAKRNFAQRSGLVNKSELFSQAELQAIQNAVQYTLENQPDMGFDPSEQLRLISLRIAHALPEPNAPEQEAKGFEQTM